MAAKTNFKEWLTLNLLTFSEPKEIYALFQCVSEETSNDLFEISRKGDQLFLRARIEQGWLMIASDKAKETFLNMLTNAVCPGLDIESWYYCQEAIFKSK